MLDGGQRMCTKCHDNTKAAQADNWNTKPSLLACGACHDGINLATGSGMTLATEADGLGKRSAHHRPGGQADDSTCVACHTRRSHDQDLSPDLNVTTHNPTVAARPEELQL